MSKMPSAMTALNTPAPNPTTRRSPGIAVLAGALLTILLQFHIRQTLTASVLYDDAFIASVAKNLALGFGYSTSYHAVDLFDPETKSGDFSRVFQWTFERDSRLSALLQARDKIMEFQGNESILLVGCGWWVPRDLEYVLPAVDNFKDCFQLTKNEVAEKRIWLVRNEIWARNPPLSDIRQLVSGAWSSELPHTSYPNAQACRMNTSDAFGCLVRSRGNRLELSLAADLTRKRVGSFLPAAENPSLGA
jgi:hypothetical protein